jgi:hypothetical protein
VEGRILDGDVLGRGMFGGAGGWYGGADKVGEVYMFVALQVIFDIDRIIFCSAILLAGVVLPTPAAPATSTVINQQSILSTMCR